MEGMPVLEFTLRGVNRDLHQAVLLRQDEISRYVQAELDSYLTTDNLMKIIRELIPPAVRKTLEAGIRNHFAYGAGRDELNKLVEHALRGLTAEDPE